MTQENGRFQEQTPPPQPRQIPRLSLSFVDWLISSVNRNFYGQLRQIPAKVFLFYLSITIVLAVTITTISFTVYFYELLEQAEEVFKEQFPPLEIKDGSLMVLGEEPASFGTQGFQVIADTTGETTSLDPGYGQGIILQKETFLWFPPDTEPQEYRYRQFGLKNWSVNSDSIRRDKPMTTLMFMIIFGGFQMIAWFLTKALQVFLATAFVGIYAEARKIHLNREDRIAIACTAIVPPIVLQVVKTLMSMLIFPGFMMIYLAVYAFFLITGTKSYIAPFLTQQA